MSDSALPQIILSVGTLIIGGVLVYNFWTHGEPQKIKGLISQDKRSEIIFDTESGGRLVTTKTDGSKLTEPVQFKYSYVSGEYKIATKRYGELTFDTDKRGPLAYICMECALPIWQSALDTLWWAKKV